MPQILENLRSLYDYVILDIDKRLDEINLKILDQADQFFVVMTADLSCLKNVRLVLETIGHLGVEPGKVHLVLNRSNAFTGISQKNAESALKRTIEYQVINEYRGRDQRPQQRCAVHVHEGGFAARPVAPRLRPDDRQGVLGRSAPAGGRNALIRRNRPVSDAGQASRMDQARGRIRP